VEAASKMEMDEYELAERCAGYSTVISQLNEIATTEHAHTR